MSEQAPNARCEVLQNRDLLDCIFSMVVGPDNEDYFLRTDGGEEVVTQPSPKMPLDGERESVESKRESERHAEEEGRARMYLDDGCDEIRASRRIRRLALVCRGWSETARGLRKELMGAHRRPVFECRKRIVREMLRRREEAREESTPAQRGRLDDALYEEWIEQFCKTGYCQSGPDDTSRFNDLSNLLDRGASTSCFPDNQEGTTNLGDFRDFLESQLFDSLHRHPTWLSGRWNAFNPAWLAGPQRALHRNLELDAMSVLNELTCAADSTAWYTNTYYDGCGGGRSIARFIVEAMVRGRAPDWATWTQNGGYWRYEAMSSPWLQRLCFGQFRTMLLSRLVRDGFDASTVVPDPHHGPVNMFETVMLLSGSKSWLYPPKGYIEAGYSTDVYGTAPGISTTMRHEVFDILMRTGILEKGGLAAEQVMIGLSEVLVPLPGSPWFGPPRLIPMSANMNPIIFFGLLGELEEMGLLQVGIERTWCHEADSLMAALVRTCLASGQAEQLLCRALREVPIARRSLCCCSRTLEDICRMKRRKLLKVLVVMERERMAQKAHGLLLLTKSNKVRGKKENIVAMLEGLLIEGK